jgi:predicted phage terminase large subunit-like protein
VLHPEREPLEVLNSLKSMMGSADFAAQYQQSPTPAGGVIVQRDWLQRYLRAPEWQVGDRIVQSWDCASKEGALNDYSVCITALIRKRQTFILDVMRRQLTFPELAKCCKALAQQHRATVILIEDAASGTQLIQHLRHAPSHGVPTPIAVRPRGDKVTRLSGVSSRIEAGDLVLPTEALWLADFERELLGFPNRRYDDQVDALSQLPGWSSRPIDDMPIVGPIIYHGNGAISGRPDWMTGRDA